MVHRVNGNAGLDLIGHFSVPDTTKKNPQGAVHPGETPAGPASEEDDTFECLPFEGNPSGTHGKGWPLLCHPETGFTSQGRCFLVIVTRGQKTALFH